MAVISGFRIYEDRGTTGIEKGGDAPPHNLIYAFWEHTEPTLEEEIIEQEENEQENEGEDNVTLEG